MSLIYGFRDKTEAQAGEISKLSDGTAGQPKINKEDIATTTGRVNKMTLKYFTLKNGQYVVNAKVETNKTDIANLTAGQVETNKTDIAALTSGQVETNKNNITQLSGTKASKLNFFSVNNGLSIANTKITNNKAEIDTISAGVSNLSNGTGGFVKKNKLGVAANKADIDKLKKVSTAGLSNKIAMLEQKVGSAKIVKATGDFYVGNSQGTFKIENLNIPPNHSIISVSFKAKSGLGGLYEATLYSEVNKADIDYNYPITDGVGLSAMKSD